MHPFRFPSTLLFAAAVTATLTLAGCQNNLRRLDALNPPANDFASALAAEYQAYAGAQAELGHTGSADYYAGKGLRALKGEPVAPDAIGANISAEDKDNLEVARQLLLSLLTPDLEQIAPQKTAHAQLLFDCWQDKASSVTAQGEKTATLCDEEFAATAAELQNMADSFADTEEMAETVHFTGYNAVLDDKEAQLVSVIAAKAAALPASGVYSFELDGHADNYRQPDGALAQARVQAVRALLVQSGIAPERIICKQGGEKAVVLSSDEEADGERRGDVDITLHSRHSPPSGRQP